MKNTLKITFALSLALCMLLAIVACDTDEFLIGDDGETYEIVTDTDGNAVTDEAGETMVYVTDTEGNTETVPFPEVNDTSDTSDTGTGIANAGADTDDQWGELIRP